MANAQQVRDLREKTGAGIMECKKALLESGDDIEQAIEFLRKQGVVKAAKKASRATREGRIDIAGGPDGAAAIVEVNCETDFVSRNDDFQAFVSLILEPILKEQPADPEALLECVLSNDSNQTVSQVLQDTIAKIGENIGVTRFQNIQATGNNEKLGWYTHAGNQIGVIVKASGGGLTDDVMRDLAMHAAAMHPLYTSPDEVPADVIAKEKEVLAASDDMAGKPEQVVQKMIEGRFKKYLSQNCFSEQLFIKDPDGKKSVGDYIRSLDSEAQLISFIRYQVGETVGSA